MANTPAPLPYSTLEIGAQTGVNGCHIYLTDPSGRKIGVVWGKPDEKAWTAHLLATAANSHEALVAALTELIEACDEPGLDDREDPAYMDALNRQSAAMQAAATALHIAKGAA